MTTLVSINERPEEGNKEILSITVLNFEVEKIGTLEI